MDKHRKGEKYLFPVFINLICVWVAFKYQVFKEILGDYNSFELNVATYTLILTCIKEYVYSFINNKKANIIADLALKESDGFALTQKIKLANMIPKNIYLRLRMKGSRDIIRKCKLKVVFPSGVTASCQSLNGVEYFDNKENVLIIPLADIYNDDNYTIEIHLLQSIRTQADKLVRCTLVNEEWTVRKFVDINTNNLLVSIG